MKIELPHEIGREILEEVQRGQFSSVDDALAEAWRSFRSQRPKLPTPEHSLGPIRAGAMRDAADELNQIVTDAYRQRREETWRDLAVANQGRKARD